MSEKIKQLELTEKESSYQIEKMELEMEAKNDQIALQKTIIEASDAANTAKLIEKEESIRNLQEQVEDMKLQVKNEQEQI